MRVSWAVLVAVAFGCRREDPVPARDARLVVAAFESVMQQPARDRSAGVSRLAALSLVDADARMARDRCVGLFRALQTADELQTEVSRYARLMEQRAAEGTPVTPDQRDAVLRIHAQASRAADAAEVALPECTHRIDEMRLRFTRTR